MNCHKGKYSCNAFDGIFEALESERDDLKNRIESYKIQSQKDGDEIDRLKAELEKLSCPICGSDVDGNNWKAKAERLAEALRLYGHDDLSGMDTEDYYCHACQRHTKNMNRDGHKAGCSIMEALAAFEELKK